MQCVEASRLTPASVRALRSLWSGVTQQAPSADHTRGVWKAHLATSISRLHDALLYLRHATDGKWAAAWNDLGAVHLLVFGKTGSADDLVRGWSPERALNLSQGTRRLVSTVHLCLQLLGLRPAAAKEWRDLRAAEPGGSWEGEIVGYLKSLSRDSAAGGSPDLGRRTHGEGLLSDWARRGGKGPERGALAGRSRDRRRGARREDRRPDPPRFGPRRAEGERDCSGCARSGSRAPRHCPWQQRLFKLCRRGL